MERRNAAPVIAPDDRPALSNYAAPAITILTPDALRLQHEPLADCARYDSLRRTSLWNEPRFWT